MEWELRTVSKPASAPLCGRHLLFDFDGTLADSRELALRLYNELAHEHQLKRMEREHLPELRRMSIQQRLKHLGIPLSMLPMLARELLAT